MLREERLDIETATEHAGERTVEIDVREEIERMRAVVVRETLDVRTNAVVPPRSIEPVELVPQRLSIRLSRERADLAIRTDVYEEVTLQRRPVTDVTHVGATLRHERLTVDGIER